MAKLETEGQFTTRLINEGYASQHLIKRFKDTTPVHPNSADLPLDQHPPSPKVNIKNTSTAIPTKV